MRIEITQGEKDMTIRLPHGLVFNGVTARIAVSIVRKHAPEAVEKISPEALAILFAELNRIKKKYGQWELVEVNSADGEQVKIIL